MTLAQMLLADEGLRLTVYTDPRGIPTIGVGRNLRDVGVTRTEAFYLLQNDIRRVRDDLGRALPSLYPALSPVRRMVLENMAFNLGISGLLEFTKMLAALEHQDYGRAAQEMRASRWSQQVKARAQRLSVMMEQNTEPTP